MSSQDFSNRSTSFNRIAWIVFALTLLTRLLVINRLTASVYFTPDGGDARFYNNWAIKILHGNWSDGKAFYGLPGYAFFMAGIYKLFGYNPFYLSGIQAVCESFTARFIFQIAIVVFQDGSGNATTSRRAPIVGLLAGLGYAFYLPAQAFSGILMPTSIAVCAYWFIVYQSIQDRKRLPGIVPLFLLGLVVGVVSLAVANLFFSIPLVLFAIWKTTWRNGLPCYIARTFVFLAAVVLGCGPAILYNRLIAHDSVLLSAHGGLNFYVGNNAEATGYPAIPKELRAGQEEMLKDSITIAEQHLRRSDNEPIPRSGVSKYWSDRASEYIHQHPMDWLKLEAVKIKNFWNALQYDDLSAISELSEGKVLTWGLSFGIVASLGLAGMLVGFLRFPRSAWVIAAIFLQMASLLTVFITERYRLAAVPGLLIFSSFFVVKLFEAIVAMQWKDSTVLLFLSGLTAIFATLPANVSNPKGLDDFNSGLHAMAANDLNRAEPKLKYAWRVSPNKDEVNFALGNFFLKKNDPQSAKAFYLRTLLLNPSHLGTLKNLGIIATEQKMFALAARFFEKALIIDPRDLKTNVLLVEALRDAEDIPAAKRSLSQALALHPNDKNLLNLQKDPLIKPFQNEKQYGKP